MLSFASVIFATSATPKKPFLSESSESSTSGVESTIDERAVSSPDAAISISICLVVIMSTYIFSPVIWLFISVSFIFQ